jgi:hypothetical protein
MAWYHTAWSAPQLVGSAFTMLEDTALSTGPSGQRHFPIPQHEDPGGSSVLVSALDNERHQALLGGSNPSREGVGPR